MQLAQLATLALAPVLIAQGRRVRRVTPRLPEATGPREGVAPVLAPSSRPIGSTHAASIGSTASTPPTARTAPTASIGSVASSPAHAEPLRLLIAGDSSAAGVGVASQSQALSGLLPLHLAQACGRAVHWRLVARTGAGVGDLLSMLQGVPPEPLDAVVIAIGVNEVTARTPPAAWCSRLDALASLLGTRFDRPRMYFAGLPPMHLFPALPQPLRWYLGTHAKRLDAALQAWAQRRSTDAQRIAIDLGAHDAQARRAVGHDALVASDGFHPGPRAYRLWAEGLAGAMAPALR